tara:strand:+ start:350 stop:625 length:276 start_codon:yes stop_codon:yes gene_type:complete
LPDGTPLFLDVYAKQIKVGDLVHSFYPHDEEIGIIMELITDDPFLSEIGIVMELITDDPFLSLGYDVRIVKVKWLRSGLARAYPIDLVVIS